MTRVIERTLTPERERDIRLTLVRERCRPLNAPSHVSAHTYVWQVTDLLTELDALRAELEACNEKLQAATANGILLSEQHEALRAAARPGRDAGTLSRYTLHAVQRERAARAWQAMQCWLLMCVLLHESKVGFVLKYRKLYPLLWGNRKP